MFSWPAQKFAGQREERFLQTGMKMKLPEFGVKVTNTRRNLLEQVLVYLDTIAVPGVYSSVVTFNITRSLGPIRCYRTFLAR